VSYFYAELNNVTSNISKLDNILSDFVPSTKKITVHCDKFFASIFYQQKVIKDVIIKHEKSDSWMIIVGMPIVKAANDKELQILIEDFIKDYRRTIMHYIDGHFALIAYNAFKNEIIAATDFNSFVPIFYSLVPDGIILCSSEVALAKLLQSDIDHLGFSQAICLGSTWGSITRFKNIHKMQSCEIITVDVKNNIHRERYWKPEDEDVWRDDFDVILERWMSLLKESVLMFYEKSIVKNIVWTDFTAGEDARLIVALCQALEIPYRARVGGFPGNKDIATASKAAEKAQIDLVVDLYNLINEDQIVANAREICLNTDGYGSFFYTCTRFATDAKKSPLAFNFLHLAGMPGGEAFRGTYYRRAKILFPAIARNFDYKFFTRLKFLLDYIPGLMHSSAEEFLDTIYTSIKTSLQEVENFPAGIKVDHLLREFQTCKWGLSRRKPFYLPLGLKNMTRSIYNIPPHFKFKGRLTRACTEVLFPKLAYTKTQDGVPTIRNSMKRVPLFLPEYFLQIKKTINGAKRRLARFQQSSKKLQGHHRLDVHGPTIDIILNHEPYTNWFSSSNSMFTRSLYDQHFIDTLLCEAKQGRCKYVEVLGRIINQEIACRYIYGIKE
jgi:hypothetical protein